MHVTEEGKLQCDVRYTPYARNTGINRQHRTLTTTTAEPSSSSTTTATTTRALDDEHEAEGTVVAALEPCVRLETIAKSIVDVDMLVLQDDGSALAAGIVAASVALADAAVELRDLVSACVVAKLPDNTLVVDPSATEERAAVGGVLVAVMPSLNEITQLTQFGELTQSDIADAIELSLDASSRLYATMRRVLLSSVSQQ